MPWEYIVGTLFAATVGVASAGSCQLFHASVAVTVIAGLAGFGVTLAWLLFGPEGGP